MQVVKKDGTVEAWNSNKVYRAIFKAMKRSNTPMNDKQINSVVNTLYTTYVNSDNNSPAVLDIHRDIIALLRVMHFSKVADAYEGYRFFKTDIAKEFDKQKDEADRILYLGDRENANFDSSLISTKASLIRGNFTASLYEKYFLTAEERKFRDNGELYIHDMRDMLMGSFNCCNVDMATVLKGGFELCNRAYSEPKSALSALQVIGDVMLSATGQQYGGFSVGEIDKVMLPYCKKTLEKYRKEAKQYNIEDSETYVYKKLSDELNQGFQSLEYKLNTVTSARGDFAFTTLSYGQWDITLPEEDKRILALICKTIMDVRLKGDAKGVTAIFPKLIYLYDENQISKDSYSQKTFDLAIYCSSKCMYPDYLSLSGNPEKNKVAKEFLKYGKIINSMGCRSFVSHWEDPVTHESITKGRCNVGVVTWNPLLTAHYCKTKYGDSWREFFFKEALHPLEIAHQFLRKRYETIKNQKCSTNPIMFTQGGLYHGTKSPDDIVGDLISYMSASLGYIGLNELTVLWKNKTIREDNSELAITILKFLKDLVTRWKKEDGYGYSLYATPAESLCSTAAKKYAQVSGDTQFGPYLTNSFHMHVKEDITPFEKQEYELESFHISDGGHIGYARIDNPSNLEAIKAVITSAMSQGYYYGINFDKCHCNKCGHDWSNGKNVCPHCGSTNVTTIDRICGYLGYSYLNGSTRINDGKLCEIKERKSM